MIRKNQSESLPTLELLDERACAFQQCVVFMRQAYPNSAVMTYDHTCHRGAEQLLLSKFVVGIGRETPMWLTYTECDDRTTADNIVGGLRSIAYTEDGTCITTELYPLMAGRDTMAWEGAALLKIKCDGDTGIWLKFGSGNIAFMHFSPNVNLQGDQIDCEQGEAFIETDTVYITRAERPLITAVKGSFQFEVRELEDGSEERRGSYITAYCQQNEAYAVVGFSLEKDRAAALASLNPDEEYRKITAYYKEKLEQWQLDTPCAELNEAFMHAYLNVEYAWLRPYGWIESIQHWPTMWHMEHTAAEEWAGNFDRVRECLRSQMKNIFESGAIPDMCTTGKGRRDWGGNNQFFFREIEHYVKMTGDLDFVREAEPYLDRALAQTFREYDPIGEGVIAWGTQIGNQEDFESTPGKGAATGSEGVRMLEILSYLKGLLGKQEEAFKLKAYSEYCRDRLIRHVWLRDMGRFAWYEDIAGVKRLDTTYHGIAYPVIYGQIDDFDRVSSLDHLKHRLSGPEGEIYQSNHFGDHAYWGVPTWGMQCGSDMQPFASAAYAKVGWNEDAVKPLVFIAKRVCGDYQRGSWPETANEKRFAYFSPSAAVFSQGIIESVFGLSMDKITNTTVIAPCFPSAWDHAALKLPAAEIDYRKENEIHKFHIRIPEKTTKVFKWKLPPYSEISAFADGVPAEVRTTPGCGWFEACVVLSEKADVILEITYQTISTAIRHVGYAACGDEFVLYTPGDSQIICVNDRAGIFRNISFAGNRMHADIQEDLLEPYAKYGWFGLMNFARRTFSVTMRCRGVTAEIPCHLVVTPKVICSGVLSEDSCTLAVTLENHTCREIQGTACVRICAEGVLSDTAAQIPSGQKQTIYFHLTKKQIALLSPGANAAQLCIAAAGGACSGVSCDFTFEAEAAQAKVAVLPLPEEAFCPKEYWREIGLHPSHGHMMQNPNCFMEGLFETQPQISILRSVPLPLNAAGFIPLSYEKHRVVTIPLHGRRIKKLYILMSAFIDNHDVFSTVFRLEAEAEKGEAYIRPVYCRDLTYPGALDMGFGNNVIAGFATYRSDTDRSRIPVLPGAAGTDDYPETVPPSYPQRAFWAQSRAAEVCNTVFNLIEVDFGRFHALKEFRLIAAEADAAGGIFAVSAHTEA